jgi:hypothetical protein
MRESERAELAYMARADRPLWKGCLPDGGTDSDIPRWLAQGLVERRGDAGFVITDKGLPSAALCVRHAARSDRSLTERLLRKGER